MTCTQIERLPTIEQFRLYVLERILSSRMRTQEVTRIVINQGIRMTRVPIITHHF
jgi:hypothetical protein